MGSLGKLFLIEPLCLSKVMLTRGNPRVEFDKRVIRNLGALKRKGLVEEYKAKNKRIWLPASGVRSGMGQGSLGLIPNQNE